MSTTLLQGDCLDLLPTLEAGSVDLILADLPYGTTACKWDSIIPLDRLWPQYKRVLKPQGVVALTASQPFTSTLVMSNLPWFRYEWIWVKSRRTGAPNARFMPLKQHESVLIFTRDRFKQNQFVQTGACYNPQGVTATSVLRKRDKGRGATVSGRGNIVGLYECTATGFPTSILTIPSDGGGLHPTQKPVALMEYLIRTYSNPGDTVLDNTFGSCTTGVACITTGRDFIGMERDSGYFAIGQTRCAIQRCAATQPPLLEAIA